MFDLNVRGFVGCSAVVAVLGFALHGAANASDMTGREMFLHEWTEGEGLGPVFNARSCVACHFQGGAGGAGTNDVNVHLLTATIGSDSVEKQLKEFHPDFSRTRQTVVLHRFGSHPAYRDWRFEAIGLTAPGNAKAGRRRVMLAALEKEMVRFPGSRSILRGKVRMTLSQRSTPALFGAGLIDKISEELLEELAAKQQELSKGRVSGRFKGKFGWKGQSMLLEDFVMGACAAEMGLQNAWYTEPSDPFGIDNIDEAAVEMSRQQSRTLVEFVSRLPAPRQVVPTSTVETELRDGHQLFESIGCADCHVRDLASVKTIYSDLLVHDMGPSLSSGGSYYGGGSSVGSRRVASASEWRTPPLWGVASSAPYMHDGSAATLHDAIMKHTGEAATSQRNYVNLSGKSRRKILAVLESLKAPSMVAAR